MNLNALPALKDNYIWMLHDGHQALVVDPGDSKPVLQALEHLGLRLQDILLTHHHQDHTGGVAQLLALTDAVVYGPPSISLPKPINPVQPGQSLKLFGLDWQVMATPGHTLDHLSFYAQPSDQAPILFCGDTLFSGGCGRLMEGTPAQMLDSLKRLAHLPDHTRVCCGHEYTTSNLAFARQIEPGNQQLAAHWQQVQLLRQQQLPSLPSSIGLEKAINPFLRSHLASVMGPVQQFDPRAQDPVSIFAALRTWKNQF